MANLLCAFIGRRNANIAELLSNKGQMGIWPNWGKKSKNNYSN
jgi:hypothetical protein